MEWLYIAGLGLNGFGFMRLVEVLGPADNTPALAGIKNASLMGGLVIVAIGFAVFQWWVPVVGAFLAPVVVRVLFAPSITVVRPQAAISLGLVLSFVGLVAY